MATITLRLGKGSQLTNSELDANFTNLNTELGTKANSSALAAYLTTATAASTYLPLSGGTLTGASTVSVGTWAKWTLETTGTTAKARQGSDGNGLNFTSNALWNGAWTEDDTTKKKFAYIQHLGNGRHEFRTAPTGAGISWTTSLTIDESAVNSTVALTQSGNQVLHAGNYTSYSPSLTGSGASGTWGISISGNAATVTNVTSSQVTTALGFTPYNNSNPSGYITSSALSGYLTSASAASTYASLSGSYANPSWITSLDASKLTGTLDNARVNGGTYTINITGNAGSATSATSANQLNSDTSSKASALQYWQLYGNTTLNPNGDWHWAIRMSHGDADTYYSATLAIPFGSDDLYFRRKTNGTNQSWISVLNSANYSSYAMPSGSSANNSVDVRAPIFYDYNNTAYYVDPNSTSNLVGLTVANTISGSISGNSASVAGLVPAQFYNNMGNNHSTYTDFNSVPTFGNYYLQGATNGPTGITGNQFYGFTLGLGNDYSLSLYGSQIYYPRRAQNSDTYIYVRDKEGGSWTSWVKIKAGYADSTGSAPGYLPLTGGTLSGQLRINSQLQVGQNTNGTAFIDAFSAFAYYGCDSTSTAMKINVAGNATFPTDVRAPIFYDSNNTAYYVDPNSTSFLVTLNTTNYFSVSTARAANEYGYAANFVNSQSAATNYTPFNFTSTYGNHSWGQIARFRIETGGQDRPSIQFSAAGTDNRWNVGYCYLDDNFRITQNMGMRNDGTSDGWGTERFLIDTSGNVQLNVSTRSPIFYDLSDTGYYIDPNSTNNAALRVRGGALFGPNTSWSEYLAVGGNGWWSGSYASVATTNGNLHLDAKSGSSTYFNLYAGSNVYFGNGAQSLVAQIASDGTFRSPIFYDYNNTGYYVDPNSTSNITDLVVRGGTSVVNISDLTTGTAPIRVTNTGTGTGDVRYIPMISGTSTSSSGYLQHTVLGSVRGTVWGAAFIGVGGNDSYPTVAYTFHYGGYATAPESWRAQIFYDSNDTAYYIDPNSSGTCFKGYGIVDSRAGFISTSNPWGTANSAYFPNGISTAGGTNWIYGNSYIGNAPSNGAGHELQSNGNMRSTGEHRATIYYDDANTAYYTNPNGTSNLATVIAQNYFCGGGNGYGIYKGYDNNNHFIAVRGAVSGSTSSPSIVGSHQTTLVEHLSPADTSTGWFFKDSYNSGNYTYATIARISRNNSWFEGALYGDSSVRAPIFYDSNDTTYYVDPATFTYLANGIANSGGHGSSYIYNRLLASNNGAGTGEVRLQMWCSEPGNTWDWAGFGYNVDHNNNSNPPAYYFGRPNTSFGQAYMRFSTGGNWYFYNTNTGGTRYETMVLTNSGNVEANNSSRAPIFYDLNNTGYYADFNSTGDSIRAAGNITAYYSDMRLKTHLGKIENALDKVRQLEGFYYEANEIAQKLGYKPKREVGVSAQAVHVVLPEIVTDAPINSNYLTIDYERLTPLLIEAMKEQDQEVVDLRNRVAQLESLITKLIGD